MTKKTLTNIADITYETAIEEFGKVLSGFVDDQNQMLSKGVTDKAKNKTSSKDAKILNRLIGTISGGYFLKDMVSGRAFNDLPLSVESITALLDKFKKNPADKNKKRDNDSDIYFYHESCKRLGDVNSRVKSAVAKKGINNLFGIDVSPNPIGLPDRNSNPSIGAVEFKKHTLSLAKRYGDALNLFFNCIPNVEMSLCTPYLDVKILVPENDSGLKGLGHGVQFRFDQFEKNSSLISKHIDKLNNAIDKGLGTNLTSQNTLYDEYGMELFTSPQTLSNSNVRKIDKNILEPNSTLLSLKNCSIDIAGLGVGLYCSKNARLQLTLHDRSRLRDIEPLISPKQFGKTRIILEYGWSHPQGGPASQNTVGKFLNSLRDKGVYIVKGSTLNFQDGGHVNITIDMAMMGSKDVKSASIASGDYVQASVFKKEIEEVALSLVDASEETKIKEVRKVQRVNISNSRSVKGIMDRETFQSIKDKVNHGKDYKGAIRQFLNEFSNLNETITDAIKEKISRLPSSTLSFVSPDDPFLKTVGVSVLPRIGEGLESFDSFTSLGSVLMTFVGYPMLATYQFDEVQMFFYPFNQYSAGAHVHTTASFPIDFESINSIIEASEIPDQVYVNKSVQSFMNSLDRKIIRNPSYRHYGISSEVDKRSAIHAATLDVIEKVQFDLASPEEVAAVSALGLTEDQIFQLAGISQNIATTRASETLDKKEKEKVLKYLTKKSDLSDFKRNALESVNDELDEKLSHIYKFYNPELKEKDALSYSEDPKFVLPNLSYYFETIEPFSSDTTSLANFGKSILESNSKVNDKKTILRIHVYDEEAMANNSQQLLLNLANSKELSRAVDKQKINIMSAITKNSKDAFGEKITKSKGELIVNNLNYKEVKSIIKQTMPNITIGSSLSNVKSFSASSTTSNEIANVIFITEQSNSENVGVGHNSLGALDQMSDMTLIPSVGTLECVGMPLVQRGMQFFIDANTGTTIDSIYTVQSVSHNIGESGFSSSVRVIYTGQNSVQSLRRKLEDLVNVGVDEII